MAMFRLAYFPGFPAATLRRWPSVARGGLQRRRSLKQHRRLAFPGEAPQFHLSRVVSGQARSVSGVPDHDVEHECRQGQVEANSPAGSGFTKSAGVQFGLELVALSRLDD
jgi:hypothetical protein